MSRLRKLCAMDFNTIRRKIWHKMAPLKRNGVSMDSEIGMKYDFHPLRSRDSQREIFEKTIDNKIIYHCYWYGVVGRKQVASILSIVATQKNYPYEIWLWLDCETFEENQNNEFLLELKKYVIVKQYNPDYVHDSSDLKRVAYLFEEKDNLADRSDGFRLWALHQFGGIYFDLDIMFLQDMLPIILKGEFVYAWSTLAYANSAMIYLQKGSYSTKYICRKIAKCHSTQPWNVFNYKDKNLFGLHLYPTSLFDPLWGADKSQYPIHDFYDFFTKKISSLCCENPFPYSYAFHWHNQWNSEVDDESLFAYLERKNKMEIEVIEREK